MNTPIHSPGTRYANETLLRFGVSVRKDQRRERPRKGFSISDRTDLRPTLQLFDTRPLRSVVCRRSFESSLAL